MEDRVGAGHGGREGEAVSNGADDLSDGEGAEEARAGRGGGRLGGEGEMGCGDTHLITNFELEVAAVAISVGAITLLGCDGFTLYGLMGVVEMAKRVGGRGGGGGKGLLGTVEGGRGGEGMVTVVGVEGGGANGGVMGAVVGCFSDGQVRCPVVVVGVGVGADDRLDGAVGAFGVGVGLWGWWEKEMLGWVPR